MMRALGIPAAVAVLVVLPGVVAQAPDKAEEPPAKEAALTVNLEGDSGGSGHPYLFAVAGEGKAPSAAATLKDTSGLHTATVAPASGCPTPARVAFPGEGEDWCLQLEDVDSGYELSGSAAGGDEKVGSRPLQLTVNRRDWFWGKPLIVLLLGLLAGALVALVKPGLRSPVRQTVLGKLLKENQSAKSADRIEGLTEFARRRLGQGEAVDDLIKKVTGLRTNGPAAARAAREELKQGLEQNAAALAGYALLAAASKEAARTDTRVDDFYGPDDAGKAHPATEFSAAIKALVENLAFMEKLRTQIAALDPERQKAPLQALRRAENVAKEAATPTAAKRVPELLKEVSDSIEVACAKEGEEMDLGAAGEGPEAPAALVGPAAPLPPGAAELGGSDLASARRLLFAITSVTVLLILLFAFFTIKQAAYDPKLTFHSGADYFTLFSTALASAAVGSVILLVGYWFPVEPAGEE